jgi:hypothetical protein
MQTTLLRPTNQMAHNPARMVYPTLVGAIGDVAHPI